MTTALDANVLIYTVDHTDEVKHARALEVVAAVTTSPTACVLALQTLAEFFAAATRKYDLPRADADVLITQWAAVFPVVSATVAELRGAIRLMDEHPLAFWDALLLATLSRAGCDQLLSEDLQGGAVYGGVRVVNPFADRP